MREFSKSHKLDYVCYDIRGPVMDAANEMEARGEKILKLNIGNPAPFGFKTPQNVLDAMTSALPVAEGYSDSHGILAARQAIIKYDEYRGIHGVTEKDVFTGNGASELITMSMQGLLDSGDEVLVPAPDYPLWTASVTLAGGTAVHYVCDEAADWNPDIADIRSKITPNTKAIVIINPNNPTGAVYEKSLLEEIVKLAAEHGLIIFSDEIYDRLLMDDAEHISIASLAGDDVFCVTFGGLSKSHMTAGFRCGWISLSGNKAAAKGYIEGLNMLSSMRLCSNVPAQHMIPVALDPENFGKPDPLLLPGGRIYEQREYIYKALNEIDGMTAVRPKAAFYIFPKIDTEKFGIVNDESFVLDFLHEKKILLVAGSGFHWEQPDHFRIVYLPELSVLEASMKRLGEFLADYRQS